MYLESHVYDSSIPSLMVECHDNDQINPTSSYQLNYTIIQFEHLTYVMVNLNASYEEIGDRLNEPNSHYCPIFFTSFHASFHQTSRRIESATYNKAHYSY